MVLIMLIGTLAAFVLLLLSPRLVEVTPLEGIRRAVNVGVATFHGANLLLDAASTVHRAVQLFSGMGAASTASVLSTGQTVKFGGTRVPPGIEGAATT